MSAVLDDVALRVALLEDDLLLRDRVLMPRLAEYGFAMTGLETAAQLHAHLTDHCPQIVVLDVGLPDADGFDVARILRCRHPQMGIVMLTGRGGTPDRVRGLSEGADAYLAKPVEIDLLAATLHSLARRISGISPPASAPTPASSGAWHLDGGGWRLVAPDGHATALTRSERRVLERLIRQPCELVSREALIATLTEDVFGFDMHRLDSLVHRLRRKVADSCGQALPLVAVHGEGYVLTPSS